jgi:tetratricopeptide (TPR) repeat protein
MQERGDLVHDETGHWVVGASLDWEQLPARVEAVIGERIGRLPRALQELLAIASVEGELFTAEVAAGVQGVARRDAIHWLSSELDRQHQLVRLHTLDQLGEQPITHYRFRHILFQKYLYAQLDQAERRYLHADVGAAVEALYIGQPDALVQVAGVLARHFEEAGQWFKAAAYLLQAGQRALRLSALEEAIALFNQGILHLQHLAERPEALPLELQLQLALGAALMANQGYGSPAAERCYRRAEVLCHRLGDATQLFIALRGRCAQLRMSDQIEASLPLCERLIQLGDAQQDPWLQVEAHSNMGATLFWMGDFLRARKHLDLSAEIATTLNERNIALQFPQDSRVFAHAYRAFALWNCGYPDQGLQAIEDAIELARRLEHPNSLAFALQFATHVHLLRREPRRAQVRNAELLQLATSNELAFWVNWAYPFRGWFLLARGATEQALASFREDFSDDPSQWNVYMATWPLALFALAHAQNLSYEIALTAIQVAIDQANALHEHSWLPELHRLRGKFLLLQDETAVSNRIKAESCFEQAIALARQQGAKSWELRAATSLAKLWLRQEKRAEAQRLLAPVYGWFTEGFSTVDLTKARQLLQSLPG